MKKLTVNESLKIAMRNRDRKIHELECENLALRIERERLREMVARYVDVAAVAQDKEERAASELYIEAHTYNPIP